MIIGDTKKTTKALFRWQTVTVMFLVIGVSAYSYYAFNGSTNNDDKKSGKSKDPVIAVVTDTAKQEDFPIYLSGLGTITALRTVTLKSRVDGELIHIAFKEGAMVKAGDLLAEIDPRAYETQLMQAEGQLKRDEALLKNAEIDLVRYQTLLEQDSIAAQQSVTQESVVKQHKGTVDIDRGIVANAKLQLSYTKITAPISGRLGLRLIDQGNIVHASDANGLAVITEIQPIAVVFTLPEDDLPSVMKKFKSSQGLTIEAYDRQGTTQLAEGKLLAVDNQIDTTTGTVKLKGQFSNEDHALFSNQFVNIRMSMDTLRAATVIPAAAIQRGIIGTFVYVVNDEKIVSVRPITIGPVEDEKVPVLKGLNPNEHVVIDGADKLREGIKVKIITRESPPPADDIKPIPDVNGPAGQKNNQQP